MAYTFFCFDTLCQLAYMIYITNTNARINIFNTTAGRKDKLFVIHNSQESATTLPRPPGQLRRVQNLRSWFSEKNH